MAIFIAGDTHGGKDGAKIFPPAFARAALNIRVEGMRILGRGTPEVKLAETPLPGLAATAAS